MQKWCGIRISHALPLLRVCRVKGYHWSPVFSQDGRQEKTSVPGQLPVTDKPLSLQSVVGYNRLIDSVKQRTGLNKRQQFYLALSEFLVREKYRKGHVPFIRTAMRRMDDFGLDKDLETYNKIIDVFPRGRFAPRRMIDAFWPRPIPQLELCLEILTKMEEKGIRPNATTHNIIKAIFGGHSLPMEKCIRIMYLFDKYKDIDPYEIKTQLPTNPVELSRLCLFRMGGVDTQILDVQLSEGDEIHDYILSSHSDRQWKRLLSLKDKDLSRDVFLHVEGPHRIWLKKVSQFYFTLKLFGGEQLLTEVDSEGLLLGMCMCLPYSEAKLQDWIRSLQNRWPGLASATIIYNVSEPEQQQLDAPGNTSRTLLK